MQQSLIALSTPILVLAGVSCLIATGMTYQNYKFRKKAQLYFSRLRAEKRQLEKENILVRSEALRHQVSPHFLFNSLTSLTSLIKTDPESAIAFTKGFSQIFRDTLELGDRHLVPLSEELRQVNAYMEIQKIRFGDNLIFDRSFCVAHLKGSLPPFALQMVVENTVKHNIITHEHPLQISIGTENGAVVVTNTLQPRRDTRAEGELSGARSDSTGIGHKNIRQRYRYITAAEPVFEIRGNAFYARLPLIGEA
jgi:LytS/YehU family sensor histidine kinase